MSNIIKLKRGLKANLNNSGTNEGELKYTTDTNELFIYSNGENKLLNNGGGGKLDWDNAISVSSPFTATKDGYIFYSATQIYTATDIEVYINNVKIGGGSHNNYSSYTINISSPISKNDILNINIGGSATFVPYKN